MTAPGPSRIARPIASAWYLRSSPVLKASSGAAVAGGGRARALHRVCGTRAAVRVACGWPSTWPRWRPPSPTGGHAVTEKFRHDPGASQPALASIAGRQVVVERAVAGRTGLSPQVAPPALNKACRLRGDENED